MTTIDITSTTEEIINALQSAHNDNLSPIDLLYLTTAAVQRIESYRQLWLNETKETDKLLAKLHSIQLVLDND